MRFTLSAVMVALALAGCSSGAAPAPTATAVPGTRPSHAPTAQPAGTHPAQPVQVAIDPGFRQAVQSTCRAFAHRDASAIVASLPHYQYNSGLRYGMLGDGEGQTGDPNLMAGWLAHANVRCRFQSQGWHGHGTVLAVGWPIQGGTALIEWDVFGGRWKINDFTFGPFGALYRAMQTARPIVRYLG